jgi:hypothetical protein
VQYRATDADIPQNYGLLLLDASDDQVRIRFAGMPKKWAPEGAR